jgi:esterase/lipase
VDYGKSENIIYKYGQQSSSFDPTSQTEDIGNNNYRYHGLKNLQYVAAHLPEWTSDVTNNYEDLEELYKEMLDVWGRYVGHVVTNVGGEAAKAKPKGTIYDIVAKARSDAMVASQCFCSPTWLVNVRKILIMQDTQNASEICKPDI